MDWRNTPPTFSKKQQNIQKGRNGNVLTGKTLSQRNEAMIQKPEYWPSKTWATPPAAPANRSLRVLFKPPVSTSSSDISELRRSSLAANHSGLLFQLPGHAIMRTRAFLGHRRLLELKVLVWNLGKSIIHSRYLHSLRISIVVSAKLLDMKP